MVLSAAGCSSFRPGFISDNSWEVKDPKKDITPDDFDGPLGGHFDDKGNWVPDDPSIELTYKFPDISAGSIFDARTEDFTPSIQIELMEFDIPGYFFRNSFLRWVRTWKLDFGVGYQRTYLYIGPRITSIFEISLGGWFGWHWKDEDWSYGVGFTIIKF